MPTRTGTPSQVNASAGNGSTSVTVPADCSFVVAFWAHWDGNVGATLSSLTLGGSAFTVRSQLGEGATTDETGVGVATLVSPATGSQTLAWTWSNGGARSEGGEIVLVYCKQVGGVRASATDAQTSTNNCAVTLSTQTTDLLLAFATNFLDSPALDGTVFINNATLNSHTYDVSQVTPGASSTTVNMTGERFAAMAAISLQAGAQVIALGQATETDTAQTFAKKKRKAVGQASQTNTSNAFARLKMRAIIQAVQVETAFSLTVVKTGGGKIIALGQAVESNLAGSFGRSKSRTIHADETSQAFTFTKQKRKALLQSIENSSALAFRRVKRVPLGQASESDSATALARRKTRVLGQAETVEVAQVIIPEGGFVPPKPYVIDLTTGQLYWKIGSGFVIPI